MYRIHISNNLFSQPHHSTGYWSKSGTGPSSKLWMPRITAQHRTAVENNGKNFSQPDHTDTQMFSESISASVTEVIRHSLMNQIIGMEYPKQRL